MAKKDNDYFELIKSEPDIAKTIVYTGCIDEYFDVFRNLNGSVDLDELIWVVKFKLV